MQFTPKTEEELDMEGLLTKGEYDFEVIEASNEVSKKNNPMIKLLVKVYDNAGGHSQVFDYLLEAFGHKLRHFCDATGLLDKYQSGNLDAFLCLNKTGRCVVGIKKADGQYKAKNEITDYVLSNAPRIKAGAPLSDGAPPHTDDDLPNF